MVMQKEARSKEDFGQINDLRLARRDAQCVRVYAGKRLY